jgi:hypothetical protein
MIMGRVLRLGKTVPSCPGRAVFAGPGFGCAPNGNHGDVMSAGEAPSISALLRDGGLQATWPAPPARCHRGRPSVRPARRAATAPGPGVAKQDAHEQTGSAGARCGGVDGSVARRHLNDSRVVSRSVPWFHGIGLSLGGGRMRSGISPIYESCLPPDNVSPRIAYTDFAPDQGMAWCGPR